MAVLSAAKPQLWHTEQHEHVILWAGWQNCNVLNSDKELYCPSGTYLPFAAEFDYCQKV
jgi:hypothetical protein